jgi:2-iminobutanoate/2-iminopropanoate deaminase
MQREIIRVEPIDSNFEKWGAPVSTCTRAGNMVFVSGMPPFDPETGEILVHAPFERQVELILEQVKKALEAAGSDLDHVLKCNVLCISAGPVQGLQRSLQALLPKKPPSSHLLLRA